LVIGKLPIFDYRFSIKEWNLTEKIMYQISFKKVWYSQLLLTIELLFFCCHYMSENLRFLTYNDQVLSWKITCLFQNFRYYSKFTVAVRTSTTVNIPVRYLSLRTLIRAFHQKQSSSIVRGEEKRDRTIVRIITFL